MTITSQIDAFVADQNSNRGGQLAGGGTLALDYDALTAAVPAGGNAVTGISGIAAGAATIALPTGRTGNAVIVDSTISTTASTGGADSYSMAVDSSGAVTLTDNDTGNSQTITGASYIVFDGAAKTTSGTYQSLFAIETGTSATIAAMYNAAFLRVPDLPGLEFYIDQYGTTAIPNMDALASDFLASPEFAKDYPALTAPTDHGGINDTAFVTQLYSGILHRSATASEIAFYDQALAGTLVNSTTGQTMAAVSRATVFEYFTASPENQADISASSGGWLINPAGGSVYLGAISSASTSAALASQVASGVIYADQFAAPTSTTNITVTTSGGTTTLDGKGLPVGGGVIASNTLSSTVSNLIIHLSDTINAVGFYGNNDIVYGAPDGGSKIFLPANGDVTSASGTVYLTGSGNTLYAGGATSGVTAAIAVYGFTSADGIKTLTAPSPDSSAVNMLVTGSASAPISGASFLFVGNGISAPAGSTGTATLLVNVGSLANDSATTMAAAANAAYKVGDIANENVTFFGQDSLGNTVMYHWGDGDVHNTHLVDASAFTGAEILVGVLASSITAGMFH